MTYWVYITTSSNYEATKKTNILGVSERHISTISKLKPGDTCLVYVKREQILDNVVDPHIVAEYEITSGMYSEGKQIFVAPRGQQGERFNLRVRLKPLKVFKPPIPFKPLVSKLSFITNKEYWSLHLKGRALIELTPADYKTITSVG